MKLKFVIQKKFEKSIIKTKEISQLRGYKKQDIDSLNTKYKKTLKYLKLTQKLYQKSWNEINDKFSKFIENVTGHKWAYKNYICVISLIEPGWANDGTSNKIMRWWRDNPYFMRRITAHELIESHFFEIYNKNYKNEELAEGQLWALSEIMAHTLTSLPKEVKEFWPWNTNYFGSYYASTGYPQLERIKGKFKQLFLSSKDFDDYIKKAINLIKKYPKINMLSKK